VAKDLRSFLELITQKCPGELNEVKEVIDPAHHEVAAYLKLLEDKGRLPVTIFHQVKDLNGESSKFPLVHNVFATRPSLAMAVGLEPSDYGMGLVTRLGEMQKNPIDYEIVTREQAPVMENIWQGGEADLTHLPAARYHEKDAGPYFVMANALRGKSGNFYNVTMNKNMVYGPKRMSTSAHAFHHLADIISEHESANETTPTIVILGHHPAFYMGSCVMTPYGNDDYKTIGGFLNEPLRLVPSLTLGDDFLIPADAEIIVEGMIPPGVREPQNPFGEISGHYQPEGMYPVIDVTAICFRNSAFMQGILPGHPEHHNLGGLPKEGSIFNAVKRVVPGVKAVSLPNSACSRFSCYISMEKKSYRDVQIAAMTAFAEMMNLKVVVVVDDDVDVYNETEVWWAITTQTRWDKDLIVLPKVQSARSWLGDAVAIIDATCPDDVSNFPERNRMPEEVIKQVRDKFELQ